jgi:hypothetical protein
MATFTELFETIEDELYMDNHYTSHPMTKRDTERWSTNHSKFIVSLEYNDKIIEVKYYTTQVPDTIDVFYCLLLDARTVYESNFPEFCLEQGYDTDSMKAFRLFKHCKKQYKNLLNFLGEELFKQFMECEMDW